MTKQDTHLVKRSGARLAEVEAEAVRDDVVTTTPHVDIYENNDEILVMADFPAVPADGISVRLEGSELTIEGVQAHGAQHPSERPQRFSRAFRVPSTVDPDGVTAEMNQGVLRVHLAKSEAAKPRRIEVRVS